MTLCEAMGVKEWWYIEETSMDLYQGMPAEEFEAALASAITEATIVSRFYSKGETFDGYHLKKDCVRGGGRNHNPYV